MKKLLLSSLFLVTVLFQGALAQNRTIRGKITHKNSNAGLPEVTVLIKGTQVSTSTPVKDISSIQADFC